MSEKFVPIPTGQIERETTISDESKLLSETSGYDDSSSALNKGFNMAFLPLLVEVVGLNYKALVGRMKKNIIWIGPLFIIWMILWTVPMMKWYTMPPALHKLGSLIIFLTATYNGFIGKAVYLSTISRNFIPWGKDIKSGRGGALAKRLSRGIGIIVKSIQDGKQHALGLLVASAGLGLFASNILTRNNKPDKYLVCLMLALAIIDDLSKGRGNVVLQMITAIIKDFRKLIQSKTVTTLRSGYIAGAGFALGLSLAFIPGQLANSYYSKVGMVMGTIVFVIGIVLMVVFKSTGGNHETTK